MMSFRFNSDGGKIISIVYVEDVNIIGGDDDRIKKLGQELSKYFEVKDFGKLRYFWGIEVPYSQQGIVLMQHKYIMDLLK